MDIALIALIVYLIAVFADKAERRKRKQMKQDHSIPPTPRESRRDKEPTWGEIWAELKRAFGEETTPAIEKGRRRRKAGRKTPPPSPIPTKMTPPSTDTTVSMRHYHSSLRPSEYILRRKQEELSRLSAPRRSAMESDSLGRRLFEGEEEEQRQTLRDALLRAEILRSRWRS